MGQPVQPPYDRCMPQVPPSNGSMACPTDVRWLRQTPSYTTAAPVNTTTVTRGNYDGVDRVGNEGYRQPTAAPLPPPAYRRESDPTSAAPIASHHQEHMGSNNGVYQFQPGSASQYVFHADQKQSVSFVVGGAGVGGGTQRIQQQPSMSSEYCGVPSSQCSMPPHPGAGQYQQHYRHQQQQQKQEEELHSWNSLPTPTQLSKDRTPLVGSTVGCSTETGACVSGDVVQSPYTVADFDDVVEMATVDGTNFMPDGCFSRAAAASGASAVANANDLKLDVLSEAQHEIAHQYLDATKARQMLDWRPQFTLDDGLIRTISWYRKFFEEKDMADAARAVV